MDDIRPPRSYGSTPPTNYGRVPGAPVPQEYGPQNSNNDPGQELRQPQESYTLPPEKNHSGKGVKIFLVLFLLTTIAAAGFAAWEYMQIKELQSDIAELQKENDRLSERVYSLNYDNRDLNQKLELANDENAALEELNQELLDTCGSACSTITP